MSFLHFINLLIKNLKWLILVPLVMAFTIYYFTKNEKKVYSSETVVYTGIASGYNLSGSNKADYFATSNAFDNLLSIINSRETKQQVAIELLASHLTMKKHDPTRLSWGSFDALKKLLPDSVKKVLTKGTIEETINSINVYLNANDNNAIYQLLNSDNPYYSVNSLQNVKANRMSSSDLIKVYYETNDAAICKHTLEILITTFINKHKLLREGQTDSVIAYFEKQTSNSYKKLDAAEQNFLDFNKNNDIINYYEQTKAVAGEKENLDALNHTLEMDKMASNSSLSKVNDNIKGRIYQTLYGAEVTGEREKLSDIYNKIALSELLNKENTPEQKRYVDSLKNISVNLEKNLKNSLDKLYAETNTPNGIPTKTILDEWLKATLASEQSKARLTVMDKRKKDFAEQYKKFAPLGATLKKIERQISVSEAEYLELLHGLNQARLTQQNNELTSKLTVVDPPYLPLKANASKRMVLIFVGAFAGFILVLALLLTNALLNKTLKEPVRAKKLIGLPMAGIYPLLKSSPSFLGKSNHRLSQQILSHIGTQDGNMKIGFTSIEKHEGKSTIIEILENELTNVGYKVSVVKWKKDLTLNTNDGILLLELPALEEMVITKGMLQELSIIYLVVRANRVWNKVDRDLLNLFSGAIGKTTKPILNGVDIDYAEDYIGEVIKKRTGIRSMIKRLAKLQFGNRKRIR